MISIAHPQRKIILLLSFHRSKKHNVAAPRTRMLGEWRRIAEPVGDPWRGSDFESYMNFTTSLDLTINGV